MPLEPLSSLDLSKVHDFPGLLRSMRNTSFSGRQLGEAFDILVEAANDPECKLVLTLSGALTIAKQGQIIAEMIDRELVDVVVTTGAILVHGLSEAIAQKQHYKYSMDIPDEQLLADGQNRVYDTIEEESNFDDVAKVISEVLEEVEECWGADTGPWSSHGLCSRLGGFLIKHDQGRGILQSARHAHIPVFVPALTDCELALDFATWYISRALKKDNKTNPFDVIPPFNPFLDLQFYAEIIENHHRWAILTIGGGVPRNWAQQVGPYLDLIHKRTGEAMSKHSFKYAVRICPEPTHWGGLSGCTYSEGVSWGKILPESKGGRFAEVYADATTVLPLLMKAVFEEIS